MEDELGISDDVKQLVALAPCLTQALRYGLYINSTDDLCSLSEIKLYATYDSSSVGSMSNNLLEVSKSHVIRVFNHIISPLL